MRTISETYTLGQSRTFFVRGKRLEILTADAVVTVSLLGKDGAELTNGKSIDVAAGTYFQPIGPDGRDIGFEGFVITSSAAQTVKLGVSNGDSGTRSVAGTVNVAGTVVVTGNVAIPTRAVAPWHRTYTAAFSSTTLLGAGVPETVILPAANTNGLIIHRAAMWDFSGGVTNQTLIARNAAPATVNDADVIMTADNWSYSAAGQATAGRLEIDLYIPAGKGLYFIAAFAQVNGQRQVVYTKL